MRRWALWLGASAAVCWMLGIAPSAGAQAPGLLVTADTEVTGYIRVYVLASQRRPVYVGEVVGGRTVPLVATVPDARGVAVLSRAATWRCERRTRRLVGWSVSPDGSPTTASYAVRTPSCRRRLTLALSRRAPVGQTVRAAIRDRWRLGRTGGRLCAAPAGERLRCRRFTAARRGRRSLVVARAARRGRLRVLMRTRWQRVRKTVYVGARPPARRRARRLPRLLVTGDSLMQVVGSFVADRLRRRADVRIDLQAGSSPSKPGLDWVAHARRQAARVRPRATLVFVGGNDGFTMTAPGGQRVACCGEPWVTEYARRARLMMLAWTRRGAGRVIWMALPAPRNPDIAWTFFNVNAAVRRAAALVPGVDVLPLDEVFTPGYRFRPAGRDRDGTHLSVGGASTAARLAIRALRARGIP